MLALLGRTMSRSVSAVIIGAGVAMSAATSAFANVITDWDEKAITVVTPMTNFGATSPYMAQRMMGISRPRRDRNVGVAFYTVRF
jgi:hypothetical protein